MTGASSGIGYELAKQFVQNGFDLLIAADGDGIHNAAGELQALGAEVEPVQANLTDEGTHKLIAAIQAVARPVDAVASNAGFGVSGRFVETDLAAEMDTGSTKSLYRRQSLSSCFVECGLAENG